MMILKASDYMNEADAKRMAELKAEYAKLSTSSKRMKEIQKEMSDLRIKTVGR